jgi:hypothetical protein
MWKGPAPPSSRRGQRDKHLSKLSASVPGAVARFRVLQNNTPSSVAPLTFAAAERAYNAAQDFFQPKEDHMRKITILFAGAAFLVMVAGVASQVAHTSTEGQGPIAGAGAGVDPAGLHRQVNTKALPLLELAPEIFQ